MLYFGHLVRFDRGDEQLLYDWQHLVELFTFCSKIPRGSLYGISPLANTRPSCESCARSLCSSQAFEPRVRLPVGLGQLVTWPSCKVVLRALAALRFWVSKELAGSFMVVFQPPFFGKVWQGPLYSHAPGLCEETVDAFVAECQVFFSECCARGSCSYHLPGPQTEVSSADRPFVNPLLAGF